MERVEAEVRAEIDRAEHRKVPAAEARIVAYSDSDSEDDLPFKRTSRRTVKGSSADAADRRYAYVQLSWQSSLSACKRQAPMGR